MRLPRIHWPGKRPKRRAVSLGSDPLIPLLGTVITFLDSCAIAQWPVAQEWDGL